MSHESLLELWVKTSERFGVNDASYLFGDYVPLSLPEKQYHTVKGVYNHMDREIESFYNLRNDVRLAKEFKDKYGVLGDI